VSQQAPVLFMSYSIQDEAVAARVKAELQGQGYTIWIDKVGLTPGTPDWEEALRNAIRNAGAILLLASPASRNSRYVKDELRIGSMYGLRLIPVWIYGDEWMESIPIGWGGTQYCDARGDRFGSAIAEVVKTLRELAIAHAPAPAPVPPTPLPPTAPVTNAATVYPPQVPPSPAPAPVPPTSPLPAPSQGFAPVHPPTPPVAIQPRNPYKGLRPFSQADAGDFFGRQALVDDLVGSLRETLDAERSGASGSRLITIIGASGSGKSSLVMAGLVPRLQGGAIPGSDQWLYLDPVIPGAHPIEALCVALSRAIPEKSLRAIRDDLENGNERSLHLLVSGLIRRPGSRAVLLIDQFEEIFTLATNMNERRRFIELLIAAATEPRGSLIVVATLRADFYDRPMLYPDLFQAMRAHQTPVLPMSVDELRSAIEGPAALPDVQLQFEGPLVGDLLFEVQGQAGALPLLQFTLDQLYQYRQGRLLTLQAYRAIGGVRGALARHAESTFATLPSDAHRAMARFLFLRLIDPGATEQDATRRRADLRELALPNPQAARIIWEVANAFIAARLLVTSESAGVATLEVSHEALIREWRRLAVWLQEGREDVRLQQQISADARDWQQHGRPADRLYRGSVLAEAQAWMGRSAPSAEEVFFIETGLAASRDQQFVEQQRTVRELDLQRRVARRQRIALSLSGLLAAVLIVAVVVVSIFAARFNSANSHLASENQQLQNSLQVSVTNTNDSGSGSLRAAIAQAKVGDAITFAQDLSGKTVTLTSGPLAISSNIIISGPSSGKLTINGDGKGPIFTVGKDQTITISNLTITGGNNPADGGGIVIDDGANLTLINVNITANHTGKRGGGIYNAGNLVLIDSVVGNNTADGDGGGIFSDAEWTTNVEASTLQRNSASGHGGGFAEMDVGSGTGGWAEFLYDSSLKNNSGQSGGNDAYVNAGSLYGDNSSTLGDSTCVQPATCP
jgi:hypothetical protein